MLRETQKYTTLSTFSDYQSFKLNNGRVIHILDVLRAESNEIGYNNKLTKL